MIYSREETAWLTLWCLKGMTPRRFYNLLTQAGDLSEITESPDEFKPLFEEDMFLVFKQALEADPDEQVRKLDKKGIRFVTRVSEGYPPSLENIPDPPGVLFIQGNGPIEDEKTFAIVGTRRASYDGKKAAKEFSFQLAQKGVTVVSGLARGIDTEAHLAALEAGGRTIAVLGNGLDMVYPPENAELARRIIMSGGLLISEMPPGERPSRYSFPARNRIIAGLSAGALIVEGDMASGAMITASFALEFSREVFAVPGSIYQSLSEGPNHLIRDGAGAALSPWDILEGMGWGARPAKKQKAQSLPDMYAEEKLIYEQLKIEAKSFEELAHLTGFSPAQLNSRLTTMQLRSIIIKLPGNLYRPA
ncbi:MAG: DNA-processing protein DprA [Clostridia bacterium]|nr:DNA-processing protein DprA [Clostridia bacterium]